MQEKEQKCTTNDVKDEELDDKWADFRKSVLEVAEAFFAMSKEEREAMVDYVQDRCDEAEQEYKAMQKAEQEYKAVRKEEEIPTESFKFCPECGRQLESDYKFCPECGRALTKTFKA